MNETIARLEQLRTAELTVLGRLTTASNATLLCELGTAHATPPEQGPPARAVYKPIAGERPLRDFPPGTLAAREVASYRISEALGWSLIPPTVLRDGPFGPGSAQWWVEDLDDASAAVDLVPVDQVPEGWRVVMEGRTPSGQAVAVAHADRADLRRLAVLDLVLNNADRKAGHILLSGGRLLGVDHGLSFHPVPKVRTVLWGWAGEALGDDTVAQLVTLRERLDDEVLRAELHELLASQEVAALRRRVDELVREGTFPVPEPNLPAMPWPLW